MHRKYAIYQRVSTEEQAIEGYSLRGMLEQCRAYIKGHCGEEIKVYEDFGYSGTLEPIKRPALNQLLTDSKSKEAAFDTVLVWKLDRLCRSARILQEITHNLARANVALESCTEMIDFASPSGKFMLGLLGSAGQFESEQIGERTFNAMRSKVSEIPLGGSPGIGYKVYDKKIVINTPQAETVREIFAQFLKLKNYSKVAATLNENSTFTAQGKLWNHKSIKNVLSNPIYIGKVVWGKRKGRAKIPNPVGAIIIKEGRHEPIVSTEIFEKVQRIISRNEARR